MGRAATMSSVRGAAAIGAMLAAGLATGAVAARAADGAPEASAPGGPGAQSYLNLARKDCFATARSRRSQVWFTVADGVLSDVFSPTIENNDDGTLQYVVTDGRSFTDLQQRDMTATVTAPGPTGMVCRVTSRDARHRFALVTDYIADPARNTVLIRSSLHPLPGAGAGSIARLRVYVRYDATVDNTGGGGPKNALPNDATVDRSTGTLVATDTDRPTGPFAADVAGALAAPGGFGPATSGFVGTGSDGLVQLDRAHRLTNRYRSAHAGNVVSTARVRTVGSRPFELALGFGPTAADAAATAVASARAPYALTRRAYVAGWRRYDATLRPPPGGARAWWTSANVIASAEDKTTPGAFVAAPADPFGQSMLAATTHPGYTYRSVFARDAYETFTGLLADGDRAAARRMVRFLYERAQQPDGSFPRDSLLDGSVAPDTYGLFEVDEDAYPLLMADEAGFAGDRTLYVRHIRPDADFVVAHGPAYGEERWEEHLGYSPSSLASEIAGLTAAAQLARRAGDVDRARLYRATADADQREVKRWTVTGTGPYGTGRYFLRLSVDGDPDAGTTYDLNNGSLTGVDQRRVVDAGFLELTRLGELPARDPDVTQSLRVVDRVIERDTPAGPAWHRYGVAANGSTDGYGDCYEPDPTSCTPNGAPSYGGVGSGHVWPLLDGERAEQDLQTGDRAAANALRTAMSRMAWGAGLEPEQVWEDPGVPAAPYGSDPATASIGFVDGQAAGSATPLIWAQAQSLRLAADAAAGHLVDQPALDRARYVDAGPPTALPVTLSSPRAGAATGGTTLVTGRTAPGAAVLVAAGPSSAASADDPGGAADLGVVRATVLPDGTFRATVPTPAGRDDITVAATAGAHASGWARVTVGGT